MNNSMERFNLYRFWHNFMKPFRINERKYNKSKHAIQAGFDKNTIKQIIHNVFQGFRIRFSDVKRIRNPFTERVWMRSNPNPLHTAKGVAGYLRT